MARCLALFSGGLDSILAAKVIEQQNIEVICLKFVTPFFGYHLLKNEAAYQKAMQKKYGLDVRLVDISSEYLAMLAAPPHGYGKRFNPCVDCKILIITKAKEMMAQLQADFLITGEVVGQRPMSQRKDTLRIIERDSVTDDILLRPLCSQSQKPTAAERAGIVKRELLPKFSGRNRTPQIELAESLGIKDFPSPAGGCILTDGNITPRIEWLYQKESPQLRTPETFEFILLGRQFRLPDGGWLVIGRNEKENDKIEALRLADDIFLQMISRPGPAALLRFSQSDNDKNLAAALVVRYGKKSTPPGQVAEILVRQQDEETMVTSLPCSEKELKNLQWPPAETDHQS